MFMNQSVNMKVPSFFELDGLEVLHLFIRPDQVNVALVVVGENLGEDSIHQPIIRLYLARNENEVFEITKELDAHIFDVREKAITFAASLNELTALELLTNGRY